MLDVEKRIERDRELIATKPHVDWSGLVQLLDYIDALKAKNKRLQEELAQCHASAEVAKGL
jgi:hypothetical protein